MAKEEEYEKQHYTSNDNGDKQFSSYNIHNFKDGEVLWADNLNHMDYQINQNVNEIIKLKADKTVLNSLCAWLGTQPDNEEINIIEVLKKFIGYKDPYWNIYGTPNDDDEDSYYSLADALGQQDENNKSAFEEINNLKDKVGKIYYDKFLEE